MRKEFVIITIVKQMKILNQEILEPEKYVDRTIKEELIQFVGDRKGHDRRYGIDAIKIKMELGWSPKTSFEVGIDKTIKWYLDNGI